MQRAALNLVHLVNLVFRLFVLGTVFLKAEKSLALEKF